MRKFRDWLESLNIDDNGYEKYDLSFLATGLKIAAAFGITVIILLYLGDVI